MEDTSLLLQAIAGYDPADPGSFEIPVGNYHAALLARTSTLRIGIPRNPFFSEVEPEIERAVSDALRVIERLTKRLVEVHLPARPQMSFGCEAWNYHRELLAKSPDAYSPLIRERIQMQAADCGPAYVDSLRNLELTRRGDPVYLCGRGSSDYADHCNPSQVNRIHAERGGAAPLCPQSQYVSHQCMGVAWPSPCPADSHNPDCPSASRLSGRVSGRRTFSRWRMHINERQNGIRERLTSDYRPAHGMQKLMSTGQCLIPRQILPSRAAFSNSGRMTPHSENAAIVRHV